jgi:hypothetical protein
MNSIHKTNIALQDTGKIMKSTDFAALIEHADQREVQSIFAYDFDPDHRTLTNLYPECVKAVDLSSDQPEGDILRVLGKLDSGVTIFDPRAHSKKSFLRAIKDSGYLESKNHSFTIWLHPLDIIEVMFDLQSTVAELGDRVAWVVVKNRGRSRTFKTFEGSELESELIDLGAGFIEIPALLGDTVNHLSATALRNDRIALPFREAIANAGKLGFQMGHAGFLQVWLRTVFAELDRIAPLIYLPEDAARIQSLRAAKLQSTRVAVPALRRKLNANID